jgi:hypothetical protein
MGNVALDRWVIFFNKEKKSNTKFISLLKKLDKFFLTVNYTNNIDDSFSEGLLEEDFRKVAFTTDADLNDEKSRLVLAIIFNANLTPFLEKYKDIFFEVIEKSLIEGDYEIYGIEFEKALKISIEKNYIDKSDFMGISLLRGMVLGKRYDSLDKELVLQRQIKINKIKTLIGL